ncbi:MULTISPECIES: Dabb family protein [unclassified Rhizobium]|uniref:Dabb family protein n=1 Tax=unclassified Rhizobium TaxID=2613769 RepID=UPI001ADA7A22|nr:MULTISPECIES: Dabb family protein [unclassified Rhizobium]MBO9123756.1 Dabb family protein [Rhizobium sp. 16-488-2b]MBO9174288.1 Dabb family protein [Rhizobium sp. 16-488-2a]
MIKHTVFFKLSHAKGSTEEREFLEAARVLTEIPGVQNFQSVRQTNLKTTLDFGFLMEFADQATYDSYNAHPLHVAFVEERWKKEVTSFSEIDYELD